jgi:hypothetical protein
MSKSNLQVSPDKKTFELYNEEHFFWLGDTCWSASWKAKWEEWETYVNYRSKQGFNVLQICSIPYEDCTNMKYFARQPFGLTENGDWDYENIHSEYFEFFNKMVSYANKKGLIVAIVLLWWNYIPNARLWTHPMPRSVMTMIQAKKYIKYMVDLLKDRDVVWLLTGDDTYYGDGVQEFNKEIGRTLKEYDAQNRLITEHPSRLSGEFFHNEKWLDFNMIQSSHFDAHQNLSYELSKEEYERTPQKPVVNAEICYEWHKGFDYGHRFNRKDVRRAFWWSVLEGSLAGITYGAEGIFNWISDEEIENNAYPNIWISCGRALYNPGANDLIRAKKLLEEIEWYKLVPSNERILNKPARHISCASSTDKLVAYIPPYTPPTEGIIELDLSDIPTDAVAKWWDPSKGEIEIIGKINSKRMTFLAPDKRDSLLIIS